MHLHAFHEHEIVFLEVTVHMSAWPNSPSMFVRVATMRMYVVAGQLVAGLGHQ